MNTILPPVFRQICFAELMYRGRHDEWMRRSEENAKINIGVLGGVRKIVSEDESGEVNLEIV